jgi:hypothetical protein
MSLDDGGLSGEGACCPCKRFEDHDELTETEASGGVKEHGVRYVLGISLLLAISAAVDHVDHSGGQ